MVTLVFIFILKRTSDVAKGTEGNQEAAKMGVIRGIKQLTTFGAATLQSGPDASKLTHATH